MNTISFDWVRIIALMPFREIETTSKGGKLTIRTINYVYCGFSLFLMTLITIFRWKGISSLNDVADIELSLFAPLPAMWGLGLPIQLFGKKVAPHKRVELTLPNAHSSNPHSTQKCRDKYNSGNYVNLFIQINLHQIFYQFDLRQDIYHINVNQNISIQNTIVFFPSNPKFVTSSTQDATLMKKKRGPHFLPRVKIGENPLNNGVRAELDNVVQHLGYNLRSVDGAAIIHHLRDNRKKFLRQGYEKTSLCAWLLNAYKDHFESKVTAEKICSSSPCNKRQHIIDDLFDRYDADINCDK